jgi:hypothetical protein
MRSQMRLGVLFVEVLTAVLIRFLDIFVQRITVAYSQEMHDLLNTCADFLHWNYRLGELHMQRTGRSVVDK